MSSSTSALSAHDLVERVGFGLAQLKVILLGSSIWVLDGFVITLTVVASAHIAESVGVQAYSTAFVVSAQTSGIALGCLLGGYLGDHCGRRLPIVLAYLGSAVFSALLASARSYMQVLLMVTGLGIFLGIGLPCSLVMQSELSPERWRMVAMTRRMILAMLGQLLAPFLLAVQDPELEHINWRWPFGVVSSIALALSLLAGAALPESPVFLASIGQLDRAREGLVEMMRLNGSDVQEREVTLQERTMAMGGGSSASGHLPASCTPTLAQQLRVILTPPTLFRTVAAAMACIAFNVAMIGHNYAEPRILVNESGRKLPPAYQILFEQCWYLPGAFILSPMDRMVGSRRAGAGLVFIACSISFACFALLVDSPSRPLSEALFQIVIGVIRLSMKLACCFAMQISAEMYPPLLASFGNAFCLTLGRIGGFATPFIFEWFAIGTDAGVSFYYAMASLCFVAAIMVVGWLPARLDLVDKEATEVCRELFPRKALDKRLSA